MASRFDVVRPASLGTWSLLLTIGVGLLANAGTVRAAVVETRHFSLLIDGKDSGEVHMTITKQDDGTQTMQCDTKISVRFLLVRYTYTYQGFEAWKDGKLQRFNSKSDDNGKAADVTAVAGKDGLDVRVNRVAKVSRSDVWLSSYWFQPDSKLINTTIPILDADTGKDLDGKLEFVGTETRTIAKQTVKVNHFKLSGKVNVDLWYDGSSRLVREEWVEEGKKVVMELNELRR